MKQYTTPKQTAKLIGLGLPRPKSIIDVWAHETDIDMEYEYEYAYSIGELIEMLPTEIKGHRLRIIFNHDKWVVEYRDIHSLIDYCFPELIDILVQMVVTLVEIGELTLKRREIYKRISC